MNLKLIAIGFIFFLFVPFSIAQAERLENTFDQKKENEFAPNNTHTQTATLAYLISLSAVGLVFYKAKPKQRNPEMVN